MLTSALWFHNLIEKHTFICEHTVHVQFYWYDFWKYISKWWYQAMNIKQYFWLIIIIYKQANSWSDVCKAQHLLLIQYKNHN